jgi:hypothetical protein
MHYYWRQGKTWGRSWDGAEPEPPQEIGRISYISKTNALSTGNTTTEGKGNGLVITWLCFRVLDFLPG